MYYGRLTICLSAHLVFAAFVSPAAAIDWINPAGGEFGIGGNWDPNTVPTALDSAVFNIGGANYTVLFLSDHESRHVYIQNQEDVTFEIAPYTYTVRDIQLGPNDQGTGLNRLTIENGLLEIEWDGPNATVINSWGAPGELIVRGEDTRLFSQHVGAEETYLQYWGLFADLDVQIIEGAEAEHVHDVLVGMPDPVWGVHEINIGGVGADTNPSSWTIHGDLDVDVTGIVRVQDQATSVVRGDTSIDGELIVRLDATWTSENSLTIGDDGSGLMRVFGSTVTSANGVIGKQAESSGNVLVQGEGSQWINSGPLTIGGNGAGELRIREGGRVENTDGVIGYDNSSVTVEGSGSSWVNSGNLSVTHAATLTINDGGFVSADNADVYSVVDTPAVITVQGKDGDGIASQLFIAGELNVGYFDTIGQIVIHSGGQMSAGDTILGLDPELRGGDEAVGTVAVRDTGSQFTVADLTIGDFGYGDLVVSDGGTVMSSEASLGRGNLGTGTATVSGTSASWYCSRWLYVGEDGTGTLDISQGGYVKSVGATLGDAENATGTATIDGDGSTWTNNGELFVGFQGEGTLNILEGGLVETQSSLSIGDQVGSIGGVLVDGAGSALNLIYPDLIFSDLSVGLHGTGSLTITGGGSVSNGDGVIGAQEGSEGTVLVNLNGVWNNSGNLTVGYAGNGGLSLILYCTVTNAHGRIGQESGSTGDVTVALGSVWNNGGDLTVGDAGTGTLEIIGASSVTNTNGHIGKENGSSGEVTVDLGSDWTNSGELTVGDSGFGAMTVSGGGIVSNSNGYVGKYGTSSTMAGGAVTVDGDGSTWSNSGDLTIGDEGDGTLSIRDGGVVGNTHGYIARGLGSTTSTVSVDGDGSQWINSSDLTVGDEGDAMLTITNGGSVSNTDSYIAAQGSMFATPGGTGSVIVDGDGSTWSNSGGLTIGDAGEGTLTITNGGSVSNVNGYVGSSSTSNGAVIVNGTADGTSTGTPSTWTNNGDLYLSVDGMGSLSITDYARVYVGGEYVQGDDSLTTVAHGTGGKLCVGVLSGDCESVLSASTSAVAFGHAGADEVDGVISTHPGGAIRFSGGHIRTDVLDLSDGGEFDWTGGLLEVARVEGSLENLGGVLYPIRTPPTGILVRGDYCQGPAAQLLLTIRASAADQIDLLHVTGDAMIDGEVVMKFINGFAPHMGDRFPLIMVDGLLEDDAAKYHVHNLAPGFQFEIMREAGVVTLVALNDGVFIPEPAALVSLLSGLCVPLMSRISPQARRGLERQRSAGAAAALC